MRSVHAELAWQPHSAGCERAPPEASRVWSTVLKETPSSPEGSPTPHPQPTTSRRQAWACRLHACLIQSSPGSMKEVVYCSHFTESETGKRLRTHFSEPGRAPASVTTWAALCRLLVLPPLLQNGHPRRAHSKCLWHLSPRCSCCQFEPATGKAS